MITVFTPTGDRPLALERCKFYLERQTIKPDQWVIVDDGAKKSARNFETSFTIDLIERDPCKDQTKSFTGNLIAGIEKIKGDIVIIFEDDDWYHPQYIEKTLDRIREVSICGQPMAVYYNIKQRRYRINNNDWRASFCETAFRSELLPKLKNLCYPRNSAFVDSRLWAHCRGNGIPYRLCQDGRFCIGIKGMPGRQGIGIGHRPGPSYKPDYKWKRLIQFIGKEDTLFYMNVYKKK